MYRHFYSRIWICLSLIKAVAASAILAFGFVAAAALHADGGLRSFSIYQCLRSAVAFDGIGAYMVGNRPDSTDNVTDEAVDVDDIRSVDCTPLPVGRARDLCEWGQELKKVADSNADSAKVSPIVTTDGRTRPLDLAYSPGILQFVRLDQDTHKGQQSQCRLAPSSRPYRTRIPSPPPGQLF